MIEVAISYADRPFTEEEQVARDRYAELYNKFKAETDAEKVKVIEAGGLCIIGTERHESRRIDNQLRGRAGRQGDPGVSIFFISLEDDLAKRFGGEKIKAIYNTFKLDEDQCLQSKMLSRSIENAQKAIEGRNFAIRKRTLQYDEVMNEQRKTIYGERLKVLKGEDVHEQMLKYIPDYVEKVVAETVNTDAMPEKWDENALNAALKTRVYPDECTFEITRDMLERWDYEAAIKRISKEVIKAYEQKIVNIKNDTHGQVDYHQIERNELLRSVDRNWIDHIDAMDQLRKGIGLRGYAQQDPVIAYKQEGYEMFTEMIERVQTTTISRLLKGRIVRVPVRPAPSQTARVQGAPAQPAANNAQPAPAPAQSAQPAQPAEGAEGAQAQPAESAQPAAQAAPAQPAQPQVRRVPMPNMAMRPQEFTPNPTGKQAPLVKKKEVGRNDPCPCGSGKKYKDCCYWKDHK